MLNYNSQTDFSPREIPRGVHVHPHRGFETVTIAYHGKIAHHNSFNNGTVEVVAGSFKDAKGPASRFTPMKCTTPFATKWKDNL